MKHGKIQCVWFVLCMCVGVCALSTSAELYTFEPGVRMENAPSPIMLGKTLGKFGFGTVHFTHEDGSPWYPIMGELHFSRIPAENWDDELQKMRDAGLDVVATYVFWNHHEEVKDAWNWTGQRNLRMFLQKCKAHGLKAWVRIGPWCHGEARNGGWPDYIQKMQGARNRNLNPAYIARVAELYNQIGQQMKGLYYKDGRGPVIGVQYDNEMEYARERDYAYMKKLYALAQAAGIEPPFHSATRWPAANPAAREFLTGIGGYPDAPWAQHLNKMPPRGVFTFRKLKPDTEVGNDYFTHTLASMAELDKIQPVMMVELGAGNQVCYHRRPFIRDVDCVAMAYTCVGSGSNALGYYMFHGGVNPSSEHYPLNEARNSGYPNDCPVMNYDFQSPLSSAGMRRRSFYGYQMLHRAVKAIEGELVSLPVCLSTPAVEASDATRLRCAYRGSVTNGFVFLSNVQRNVNEQVIPAVQFAVNGVQNGKALVFPEKPIDIPVHAFGIWPVRYSIPETSETIVYATGTLIKSTREKGKSVLAFARTPGIDFEIRFASPAIPPRRVPADRVLGATGVVVCDTRMFTIRLVDPSDASVKNLNPDVSARGMTISAKDITPPASGTMPAPDFAKLKLARQTWKLQNIPGERRYEVTIPASVCKRGSVILEVDYFGDVAGLYQNGIMVDDDFWYGRTFVHRFNAADLKNRTFVLQIVPLHPEQPIYFDDDIKARIPAAATPYGTAELKSIRVFPCR